MLLLWSLFLFSSLFLFLSLFVFLPLSLLSFVLVFAAAAAAAVLRLGSPVDRSSKRISRGAAVVVRLYSGWSYVSLRLGAEVVEYEESGASDSRRRLFPPPRARVVSFLRQHQHRHQPCPRGPFRFARRGNDQLNPDACCASADQVGTTGASGSSLRTSAPEMRCSTTTRCNRRSIASKRESDKRPENGGK